MRPIFILAMVATAACARSQPRHAPDAPGDPARSVLFRDTAGSQMPRAGAREFETRRPASRDSLLATLRVQRQLWSAARPRDYRFLLRSQCFCPGQRGWLLIEVREGQPLRAFDPSGRAAALADWNTFGIDTLFENLRQTAAQDVYLRVAFDPSWHFPSYVSAVYRPGPDAWWINQVRGFRPM